MVVTGVVHALTLDNSISRGKGGWLANKVARQGEGVLDEQSIGGVGRHVVLACLLSSLKMLKLVLVAKAGRLWVGVWWVSLRYEEGTDIDPKGWRLLCCGSIVC